jgi:hypothetical protein
MAVAIVDLLEVTALALPRPESSIYRVEPVPFPTQSYPTPQPETDP